MRKTKKLLSAALAGVMALSMTACGGTESNGSSASGSNSGEAGSYTVGICQLQQHPALDAATKGFRDKLDALVQADGGKVTFEEQNASGDSANCTPIINGFVSAA